ncbi:MAG: hypothetical protein KDD37_02400 [Bdellovibrionales bacterium]|nr:hypothetical protein [Bdellovibrionales bacterium]
MKPCLGRIIIYAKNIEKMRLFYETFFGYKSRQRPGDRMIELNPSSGGAVILLHPMAKSVKPGQVNVKLVFDVKNVEAFKAACLKNGLKFGAIYEADGYSFCNAKDPDKNSIQISSRGFTP